MDPLESVRTSCSDVMRSAKDVVIDDAKLADLAKELAPNATFTPFAMKPKNGCVKTNGNRGTW